MEDVNILEMHKPENVGLKICKEQQGGYTVRDCHDGKVLGGPFTKHPFIATILTKRERKLAIVMPDGYTAFNL